VPGVKGAAQVGDVGITLCPQERLDRAELVMYGDTRLPALGLWEIEATDPGTAAVLARTRAVLAEQSGS
jgi:hypothetical protein